MLKGEERVIERAQREREREKERKKRKTERVCFDEINSNRGPNLWITLQW